MMATPPCQGPYYESRFIRANAPDAAQAVWLRETLLLPVAGEPRAEVWVMVFDPSGHRALKRSFPIEAAEFGYKTWSARIATTSLDDDAAYGSLVDAARWDIGISAGGQDHVRLLTDRAYRGRFPAAKSEVRHPLARFDGRLELEGHVVDIDGWTGSVNHNWGTRHTPAYAFGQVCGFDDAPDSTLEIVTARAALGPVLLPGATLLVFRHAGTEFAVRSLVGSLKTHGRYAPFTWTFGARVDEHMIQGEIIADPGDVIGLTYADTQGATKYCYNSGIARCRIQLAGMAFERSELVSRNAMFEILTEDRLAEVPLLV